MSYFRLNERASKRLFVVDNFYADPYGVRDVALSMEFKQDIRFYKGYRSTESYISQEIKESFERIIGQPIVSWEKNGTNGCFQITTAEDPQVYHCDLQTWAGIIYLTPGAPPESGTRLHAHKQTGLSHGTQPDIGNAFTGGFFDSTKFDTIAMAGNIFNRLVIMDAKNIHSAGTYFGNSKETGRLVQLFFFD